MSDEPAVEPIRFTRATVLVVESWPQRTAMTDDFLKHAHKRKASVDGDTVTFCASNGRAVYRLRHDLPRVGKGIVAELVEGDTPSRLKQRAAKYGTVQG